MHSKSCQEHGRQVKETLAYLSRFAPDQVTGNILGKARTDLWLSMQLQLEEAHADQTLMAGLWQTLLRRATCCPECHSWP